MAEESYTSVEATDAGADVAAQNASSSSFPSVNSPLPSPLEHRLSRRQARIKSRPGISNLDERPMTKSLAQFSFAPATKTTVVTTTTTTTTTFPPLIINAPRALRDLDPKQYPLASSPTPASLRNIKFQLGGKLVVLDEPEHSAGTLKEGNEKEEVLLTSNRVVPSLATFVDGGSTFSHSSDTRSLQPSRHHISSARRPVSPLSIPEKPLHMQRTRPTRIPSEPAPRRSAAHAATEQRHPHPGLATPEADIAPLKVNKSGVSGRTIHNASYPRREILVHPPLLAETNRRSTMKDFNLRSKLENESSDMLAPWPERSPADGRLGLGDPTFGKSKTQNLESLVEQEELAQPFDAPGNILETSQPISADESSTVSSPNEASPQDMCLPSPSLSPVTAFNSKADSSFDSTEDLDADTDCSCENKPLSFQPLATEEKQSSELRDSARERSLGPQEPHLTTSLMDIPVILDFFDSVPDELKTYLMYQFLKRCPKSTLQLVNEVVNPALKCDFLTRLPLELSLNIVRYFDVQTMCRAAQVSKKWREIVNSDEKAWKELFDRSGFVLSEGELTRAIKEGWGWQFPNGRDNWEKDLSSDLVANNSNETSPRLAFPPAISQDDRDSTGSWVVNRHLKRKAATRISSRKSTKRKVSARGTDICGSPDWMREVACSEGPYAAASAAAAAIPYPDVGLPSLRNLHLYKSLYQRHYCISRAWMRPDVKPRHIAFQAHGRHVVTCLQFDANKILTGSDDTNINVYDTQTGALKATLRGHEGGVWALEYYGNTLVSGSTDRSVRVWDIERAKCTQVFQGHISTVRCLQIVPPTEVGRHSDGTPKIMPKEPLIITGSRDSNLRVWKLPQPGDPLYYQRISGIEDTACPFFVRTLSGHLHSVRAIAAHGDTLVSGSYDCSVRVWKISTGETLHRLQGHTLKVYSVVLDYERNRCISGSMDNTVKVWSLDTGSLIYNLEGHTSLVGLLDLKNNRLVSAAADSTLRIWDPDTGRCKSMLSAHTGAITCFQHDGQKVISGSDRTLKMWDIRTGECVRDLLTELNGVWQVRFDHRRCVAAVQRDQTTFIEVLDFGAFRDGVPERRLGQRFVVNQQGKEAGEEEGRRR